MKTSPLILSLGVLASTLSATAQTRPAMAPASAGNRHSQKAYLATNLVLHAVSVDSSPLKIHVHCSKIREFFGTENAVDSE